MDIKYNRIISLIGKNNFKKLQNTSILLLGVGGVGGVCLDCLYRSGVTKITIVDYDTFDTTNQNRQLYSELHLQEPKVDALKQHYPTIQTINTKITPEWIATFDFSAYDIVIDAIDDREAKIVLALKTHKKLLSSFGSAKRLDPTKIKVADIFKTYGDKFGAKIRYELRKKGFKGKYQVVFSDEEPKTKEMGSFMGVTGSFGLMLCSLAIKKAIE